MFYSTEDFKWVAAHEFGHLLGVDDAYNMRNPPYSIFNDFGTPLQSNDLLKVIQAFVHNHSQGW